MRALRTFGAASLLLGLMLLAVTALRAQSQAPVPAMAHGTATWTSIGMLLTAGGTTSSGISDQLVRIGPGQTPLTSQLLAARTDHAAVLLPDGSLALSGGRDARGAFDSIELFDPQQGTGALSRTRLIRPVHEHAAALLPDGRVLVTGGRDAGGQTLSTVQAVDIPTGHAVELLGLIRARAGHTITVLTSGAALIAGGE